MKKIVLLVLLLFSVSVNAQKVSVKISPEIVPEGLYATWKHLYSDSTGHYGYYTVSNKLKESLVLLKYSKDCKQVFKKEFPTGADRFAYTVKVVKFGDGFLWLTNNYVNKTDKFNCTPIGLDGKLGKIMPISSTPASKTKSWEGTVKPICTISEKGGKMSFVTIKEQEDSNMHGTDINIRVFDTKMNLLSKKDYRIPYEGLNPSDIPLWARWEAGTQEMFQTDESGNVFYTARVLENETNGEPKNGRKASGYFLAVFQFKQDADAPKIYNLDLGGSYIQGERKGIDPQGNFVYTAILYSKSTNAPDVAMSYCVKISPTDEKVLFNNILPLVESPEAEADTSEDDAENSDQKNSKKEPKPEKSSKSENYIFQPLKFAPDGSIYCTAETRIRYEGERISIFNTRKTIFLHFSPEGKLQNKLRYPLSQSTQLNIYISTADLITSDGKVFFLYNEHKKNIEKGLGSHRKVVPGSSSTVMGFFDAEGQPTIEEVLKGENQKKLLHPAESVQIDDNTMLIIMSDHSREDRISRIQPFHIGIITIE